MYTIWAASGYGEIIIYYLYITIFTFLLLTSSLAYISKTNQYSIPGLVTTGINMNRQAFCGELAILRLRFTPLHAKEVPLDVILKGRTHSLLVLALAKTIMIGLQKYK